MTFTHSQNFGKGSVVILYGFPLTRALLGTPASTSFYCDLSLTREEVFKLFHALLNASVAAEGKD